MTKMTKALLAVGAAAATAGCAYAGGKAAVKHKLLQATSQLKLQLAEENNCTEDRIAQIEVQRPWYSLDPEQWTYLVTLEEDDIVLKLRMREGYFIPALPEPGA